MIGTKYTTELLAALAKTPRLKGMEVSATPDGKRIASYTTRFLDEEVCKTVFFDVIGEELASMTVDYDAGGIQFGSILGRDVEKVTVASHVDGLIVSFVIDLWPEDGLDKRLVVLPAGGSVEFKSEVGVVSVIEETHTDVDKITSFFEDATSDEPWLVIVEPNRKEE